MITYAARRLLVAVPLLLVSSAVVFALIHLSGDPLLDLRRAQPPVPEAVLRERERLLYLDHSLPAQYWYWLTGLARGTFGPSITGLDIGADLVQRLGVTLRLVSLAMVLAVLASVAFGVLAAVRPYGATDLAGTLLALVSLSLPVFWLAALLKEFLAVRVNQALGRTVLYTVGDSTPNLAGGFWERFANQAGHLVLPTLVLAALGFAVWSRFVRSAVIEVLDSDHVRLARAKGLSARRVLVRHALRCALVPFTTVVALDIGAVLGGTIVTERVFGWHGMGELLLTAVQDQDVNRVLAWLLVSAVAVVLLNLVADLLYAVLDPRVRLG